MIQVNKLIGTRVFFNLSHHLSLSLSYYLSIIYVIYVYIMYRAVMGSGVIKHFTEQYKFRQKLAQFGLCMKDLTLIMHSSHPLSRSTIKVHDCTVGEYKGGVKW